ncbi:MAG: hypothetical protein PHD88_03120 [Firmicutes bacterium]|nr:hypothetical protein [Bacillota bacterium]MDD4693381.1 hypothetical protein [Bacillota bacterium]
MRYEYMVDKFVPVTGCPEYREPARVCLIVDKVYDARRTRLCELRQFDATPPVPPNAGPYQVLVCEIVPNSSTVIATNITPIPGTIPPLAFVSATVACNVRFVVADGNGVQYEFIRQVPWTVEFVLYVPDPNMDVLAEVRCECLDFCLPPFSTNNDVIVSCYFGAFIQVKVHAQAELCIKEYGECLWPEITTQAPNPCIEFLDPEATPYPPFNLPQQEELL